MANREFRRSQWLAAARARVRDAYARMPPDVLADLGRSFARVRKARTPRQAVAALEGEIEYLFDGLAPSMVDRPLPLRTPARALTAIALVAGAAALVDEIEAIALLIPGVDAAAIPTLPLVAAAALSALALEAYMAASLRVHMLRSAGVPVHPDRVVHDTLQAMTGRAEVRISKVGAQMLTRRMLRRWSRGVVPLVGIGYASWDARRTIQTIARMPV